MAVVIDTPGLDDEKKAAQADPLAPVPSVAGAAPAGAGTPVSAKAPGTSSGQYVNLQKYMAANKPQAEQSAMQMTGDIREAATEAGKAYMGKAETFGKNVAADAGAGAQAAANLAAQYGAGTAASPTTADTEKMRSVLAGTYAGPQATSLTQAPAEEAFRKARERADFAATEAGRSAILRDMNKQAGQTASSGEHRLSNYLLNQPEANQDAFNRLSGDVARREAYARRTGNQAAQDAVWAAQAQAQADAKAARETLTGRREGVRGEVESQLTSAQTAHDAQKRALLKQMARRIKRETGAYNIGDARPFLQHGDDPTRRGIRTAEQAQELSALNALLGGGGQVAEGGGHTGASIDEAALAAYIDNQLNNRKTRAGWAPTPGELPTPDELSPTPKSKSWSSPQGKTTNAPVAGQAQVALGDPGKDLSKNLPPPKKYDGPDIVSGQAQVSPTPLKQPTDRERYDGETREFKRVWNAAKKRGGRALARETTEAWKRDGRKPLSEKDMQRAADTVATRRKNKKSRATERTRYEDIGGTRIEPKSTSKKKKQPSKKAIARAAEARREAQAKARKKTRAKYEGIGG